MLVIGETPQNFSNKNNTTQNTFNTANIATGNKKQSETADFARMPPSGEVYETRLWPIRSIM